MKFESTKIAPRKKSSPTAANSRSVKRAYARGAKRYMKRHAAAMDILSAINQEEIAGIQAITKRLMEKG